MEDDKMLVFSQSLNALNAIEMFLQMRNWGRLVDKLQNPNRTVTFSHWALGQQYLRIDGSSTNRQKTIDKFNSDSRIKLMLISTRAGNMGINLQAANRVVIFDTSWNPVSDLQVQPHHTCVIIIDTIILHIHTNDAYSITL
jgi:SNF2 family DNA or RNA helicase